MIVAQEYELVPVDRLTPHPDNPRRGNVAAVAESVDANGFYGAIVAQRSTGHVLAGNHRLLAARDRGLPELPVVWVDVDDDRARRILLVDNRSNDLAVYDEEQLLSLLGDLPDLVGTGYTADDLLRLASGDDTDAVALTDPDDVPEVPAAAVSKPGAVWACGPHLVTCGDSTDPATYQRLLGGATADLVWTDPPYGVDVQERDLVQAGVRGRRKDGKGVLNDDLTGDNLARFLVDAFTLTYRNTRPGACWYVASPPGVDHRHFLNALAALGVARHTIVWVKDRFVMGRADYHYRHESIVYGWSPGAAHHPVPTRDQDTVWAFARPARSVDHPTMKPVALIERAIENSTDPGETVLDPFGGSGSTMIAAHATGRVARLVELDPSYVDVICRRWQEHTGEVPVDAVTGQAHDFVGGE